MIKSTSLADEKQILYALKRGDQKTYQQMYIDYYKMAFSFITQNGGSKEDAEDLFQEALIVLIGHIRKPKFKLTSKLSTYLYSIIRQMWLYKLRSKKHTVELKEIKTEFVELPELCIDDEEVFETKHQLVEQLLKDISEECRKIIIDYYYKNLKLKDIGYAMNYTNSFVKVKKNRCMNSFIKKIKAHPDYKNI